VPSVHHFYSLPTLPSKTHWCCCIYKRAHIFSQHGAIVIRNNRSHHSVTRAKQKLERDLNTNRQFCKGTDSTQTGKKVFCLANAARGTFAESRRGHAEGCTKRTKLTHCRQGLTNLAIADHPCRGRFLGSKGFTGACTKKHVSIEKKTLPPITSSSHSASRAKTKTPLDSIWKARPALLMHQQMCIAKHKTEPLILRASVSLTLTLKQCTYASPPSCFAPLCGIFTLSLSLSLSLSLFLPLTPPKGSETHLEVNAFVC